MGKLPKIICVWFSVLCMQYCAFALEYENTADNPRLVNLSEKQHQYLRSMEKRRFGRAYEYENSIDRIERLEIEYFDVSNFETSNVTNMRGMFIECRKL